MPKLEYRICAVRGDTPVQIEQELNSKLRELSEEGWRFVETIYGHNSLPLLLFKKQTKLNLKFGGECSQAKPFKQK